MEPFGEASFAQHNPVVIAVAGNRQVVIREDDVGVSSAGVKRKPSHCNAHKRGRVISVTMVVGRDTQLLQKALHAAMQGKNLGLHSVKTLKRFLLSVSAANPKCGTEKQTGLA